jgi:hydrogenase 3 maturation protease
VTVPQADGPDERPAAHAHSDADDFMAWTDEVRHHLRPGFVVLGVGSRLRGDDAAGPLVAERLAERGFDRAFDCGGVPENYLGRIEALRPPDILFVDAVDFGQPPGTIGFFGGERFAAQSVSTHSAGLSPLMDWLDEACDAVCYVLAIQPEALGHGEELSAPVARAVEQIADSDVWFESGR